MTLKIQVPPNVKLLIKPGQKVDFQTPLYNKSVRKNIRVPVAKVLDIKPEKIFFHLKAVVGEEIHKGEVLAVKKNLLKQNRLYSEYDGLIKEINHEDGSLTVSALADDEVNVLCYFAGEVESVDKDTVKLKVSKGEEYDLKEESSDFGGKVYYFKGEDVNELKQEGIDSKVLFIKKIESFNQVRLEVMGVDGFITYEALSQKPSVSYARIKNEKEWDEIAKASLSYCLISGSKIYFYQ